ncbi:MAG: hypothetical protein KAS73_13080 [Candidatus Sabulitectum sp.]|nr:hypothetical protein [Candidatus Sabulitectum sp.]
MKSCSFLLISILFLLAAAVIADTPLIRTTVSDSSRVVLIAQTPLLWESAEYDNLDFIRFTGSPVTDSIGYPELPMITCLVAIPDSVTPEIEFSYAGLREIQTDPVYPAPAHILSTEFTPAVVDSFVQDSTAYISDQFWPSEPVRIIGETRICGQRLLKVQLFPARYRASDSTLTTVSSINVSVHFDYDALPPDNSDFPITLPDDVTSYGGFSIGDIDRDGTIEIVFGTSDGFLHCWELGSCDAGYTPWPQFQHDDGRTGVLE